METIFSDNAKANSEIRNNNIALLKVNGFIEGGLKSTSGNMYINELKTKAQIVFGTRCNVSGKRNKYFSLSKDFNTINEAKVFFNTLKNTLHERKN